jgi:hypothetical protein
VVPFFPFRTFLFITSILFSRFRAVTVLVSFCAAAVTLQCLFVVTKLKT